MEAYKQAQSAAILYFNFELFFKFPSIENKSE